MSTIFPARKKWVEEQARILKEWQINDKLKIPRYKANYHLIYFYFNWEDCLLGFSVTRHLTHSRYYSDLKRNIQVPCEHRYNFEGDEIFRFKNLSLEERIKNSKKIEVETDEKGHDLQCSSGVGFECDCFKKNHNENKGVK